MEAKTKIFILENDEKYTQEIISGLDCPECEIKAFRDLGEFAKGVHEDNLPDVLLMNFNLNSGFNSSGIIEYYANKIPVIIVISRKYDRDTRELCYKSGATDVIRKEKVGEIIRATRNLWKHRQTVAINHAGRV